MQARYRERLHWLDIVSGAMAAAVIGALFMPWYQIGDTLPEGPQVALSVTALGHFAGGWRWLLFVVALASLCEVVIATIARASTRGSAVHSGLQAVFGLTIAALAVACFFLSPLPDLGVAGSLLGIHRSAGPGAYVGVLAGLIAGGAGIARSFVAPPSVMG